MHNTRGTVGTVYGGPGYSGSLPATTQSGGYVTTLPAALPAPHSAINAPLPQPSSPSYTGAGYSPTRMSLSQGSGTRLSGGGSTMFPNSPVSFRGPPQGNLDPDRFEPPDEPVWPNTHHLPKRQRGTRVGSGLGGTPDDWPRGITGRFKALLVGIDYCGQGRDKEVYGTSTTIRRWEAFLRKQGWIPDSEHMRILDDSSSSSEAAYPSGENIMEGLRWLMSGVQNGDSLFFAFGGHARPTEQSEAMAAVDGTPIDDAFLYETLVRDLPAGARLTIVVDCFHGGTVIDLPNGFEPHNAVWSSPRANPHRRPPFATITSPGRSTRGGDVVVVSTAWDASAPNHDTRSGGVCTNAFLGAIDEAVSRADEEGSPRRGKNAEVITYAQLLDAMHHHLRRQRAPQVPRISTSHELDMHSPASLMADGQPIRV